MKRSLKGASVLLAGASGGLGRALGARLDEAGAKLLLFGRSASRLEASGLPGPQVMGDISDAESCRRAVEQAVAIHGRLDGVVNAAGVVAFGPVESLRDPVVDDLLATNLIGPLRLVQAALPALEEGGFLAQVSAIVAERPTAGMAFYSATKAALTAFDHALARELRRRRIDVLDIRPPHLATGLDSRPIAGEPPRLAEGMAPDRAAERIVRAIEDGDRELGSDAF
jgi:cyclic-di-GMP-binding biofilm dispersal mediator protein